MVAIGLLVLTGIDVEAAIQCVSEARGCSVPETKQQHDWLSTFARTVMTQHTKQIV